MREGKLSDVERDAIFAMVMTVSGHWTLS